MSRREKDLCELLSWISVILLIIAGIAIPVGIGIHELFF